jgi:hypothetical protein
VVFYLIVRLRLRGPQLFPATTTMATMATE